MWSCWPNEWEVKILSERGHNILHKEESNKPAIVKYCWERNRTFDLNSTKITCKLTSIFVLEILEVYKS